MDTPSQTDIQQRNRALENACAVLITNLREIGGGAISIPTAPISVSGAELQYYTALENYHAQLADMLAGKQNKNPRPASTSVASPARPASAQATHAPEPFSENGAMATDAELFGPDIFEGAVSLMGELGDMLKQGCLLMHPNVKARLKVLDSIGFKTLVRPSGLPFDCDTYHEIPIFTSVALARPGTAGGFVYETFIMTQGTVGYGEKPQQGDTTDVASLQYFRDRDLNNELIWDRTRFMIGVNGTKFVGTPANVDSGPSRAELQNPANWQLVYQTPNRVGAVCIRTNG